MGSMKAFRLVLFSLKTGSQTSAVTLRSDTYECELVVHLHQVLDLELLQHHKVVQVRAPPTGTVLTVHHVGFPAVALGGDKQQVEHLNLQVGGGSDVHIDTVRDIDR